MQIIGADDSGIPGAEVAEVDIIAGVEINTLQLDIAEIAGGAVIDP